MRSSQGFEYQVFETIRSHMLDQIDDLHRFARTRYSFEEWFNWEAFSACDRVPGWTASPRPRYDSCGATASRDFGDLLVEAQSDRLMLEVAIVHSDTGNKWFDKIAHDTAKLERLPDPVVRLQIVGVFSGKNPLIHESWAQWLDRMSIWSDEDRLVDKAWLGEGQRAMLAGWAIDHCPAH
jgi:hypothetical protein